MFSLYLDSILSMIATQTYSSSETSRLEQQLVNYCKHGLASSGNGLGHGCQCCGDSEETGQGTRQEFNVASQL